MKAFFRYIWQHRTAYLMVAPLVIGVLIFCYYPPIHGIFLAFTDKTAAVDLLQEESQTVRTRIDALVASLNPENA